MQASLIGSLGTIPLTETPLTIGRATDNSLAIADPQSSSHHAEIRPIGQEYAIVDLNSTNGTFVNEQRLPPQVPRPLISGDTIRIGTTSLTYEVADSNDATMRAATSEYINAGYAPTVAGPPVVSSPDYPSAPPSYPDYQQPNSNYGQPSLPDYQPQAYSQGYPQQGYSQPGYPQQPAYPAPPMPPVPPPYPQQWNAAPGQIGVPVPVAPSKKKRRTGLVVGVIVLLLVIVGGAVGGYLYANRSTPEKTLTAYCTAWQNSDAQGVYNQLSTRSQSLTSVAKISQGMQQLNRPIVGGIKNCTFSSVQLSGSTATAALRFVVGDTIVPPINENITLIQENGTWKVNPQKSSPTPVPTQAGL